MDDQMGPKGNRAGDDAVRRAREQFDDAIELLASTKGKLKRGELEGVRDVAPQVALVIKTLVALNEARGKVHDLDPDEGGGAVLDLDAARSEIRGRLDRLRAAEGP